MAQWPHRRPMSDDRTDLILTMLREIRGAIAVY
jgi:hypothetical protein